MSAVDRLIGAIEYDKRSRGEPLVTAVGTTAVGPTLPTPTIVREPSLATLTAQQERMWDDGTDASGSTF